MLIDLTLKITPKMLEEAKNLNKKELEGHLGTHFDVMDKDFPLEYTERKGIVFDVSAIENRDIGLCDVDITKIGKQMFVAFYTGYADREEYGSKTYFKEHPQLSDELINALVEKEISIIALDFAGIRRGKEHSPKDQYCADNGVFVVENLCNLGALLRKGHTFIAHTYPMNFVEISGLPCRVIAEI